MTDKLIDLRGKHATPVWQRFKDMLDGTWAKVVYLAGGSALTPADSVISVQPPAYTTVMSTALEASKVLKNAAGKLKHLSVYNSNVSPQFILLMDSATVPGDGAVTLLYPPIPVAGQSLIAIDFDSALVATAGIAVSNSSTGSFTKTIGAADCAFYAQVY